MSEKKYTIVVVDDNRGVLKTVTRVLQKAGYVVYTCELWARVPGFIRHVLPDLVLLDYHMPTLKGDEICRIIKQSSPNPNLKVVLFSAEEESFLQRVTRECGADGYILKNFGSEPLLSALRNLLPAAPGSAPDSRPAPLGFKLHRVLLVDDSALTRRFCRQVIIQRFFCEIIEAGHGREALHKLWEFPDTDLILLDINMPVMNGIQFLETVKQHHRRPQVPIIVCSTEDREEDILRGLNLGAKGYLVKPFTAEGLSSIIQRVMEPPAAVGCGGEPNGV